MMNYLDYWKHVQHHRIYSKRTGQKIGRDEFYRGNLATPDRIGQLVNGLHPLYKLVREGRVK